MGKAQAACVVLQGLQTGIVQILRRGRCHGVAAHGDAGFDHVATQLQAVHVFNFGGGVLVNGFRFAVDQPMAYGLWAVVIQGIVGGE